MLPAWLGTLVSNPLQHLHWLRKKQKPKAEGGKGGSGGGAGEGVKRAEKEEMWEFVSGELSGTLQGRREIPEDVMLFDAASDACGGAEGGGHKELAGSFDWQGCGEGCSHAGSCEISPQTRKIRPYESSQKSTRPAYSRQLSVYALEINQELRQTIRITDF